MPELPEVETVKNVLEPQLKGCCIEDIELKDTKVAAYPEPDQFIKRLKKKKILSIKRRGKFLIINLTENIQMIVHFRMTGTLLVASSEEMFRWERIRFFLKTPSGKKQVMSFADQRRFGRLWVFKREEDTALCGINKLGIEPFSKDLTGEYLQDKLGRRNTAIKSGLLDQGVVAGLGNIYSDELLYICGIRPDRRCCSLKKTEWECLAGKMPQLLRFMIEKNRITAEAYLEGRGMTYRNTPYLNVYGHEGESCPRCGTVLKKMKINGRTSVYCPLCQKKEAEKM